MKFLENNSNVTCYFKNKKIADINKENEKWFITFYVSLRGEESVIIFNAIKNKIKELKERKL